MKKTLAIILTVVLCVSFAACSKTNNDQTQIINTTTPPTVVAPELTTAPTAVTTTVPPVNTTTTAPMNTTTSAPVVNTVKYNLKQTVSTNIVDFTLEDAQLTYYVSNNSTNYVEPTETPNSLYAAKVGTCFVSMTVTITNKDRGGSINFGGSFADWNPTEWNVIYNSTSNEMYGFDLNMDNYKKINMAYSARVDKTTGNVIAKNDSSNYLISAGETVTVRMFGIIHTEPASLKDAFDLEIKVPNSTGAFDSFVYAVPVRA